MDKELRIKFSNSIKSGDIDTQYKILGMALSGACADLGAKVHIAGEEATVH